MSELLTRDLIADKAIVHEMHPAIKRGQFDQTFEIPNGVYATSLGLFVTFLATMVVGFGNPGLGIPMAIFGVFLAGFYGIPTLFVKQAPEQSNKAMSWGQFKARGVKIETGHLPARDALAQMLVLPVLIVLWGFACITIAALV